MSFSKVRKIQVADLSVGGTIINTENLEEITGVEHGDLLYAIQFENISETGAATVLDMNFQQYNDAAASWHGMFYGDGSTRNPFYTPGANEKLVILGTAAGFHPAGGQLVVPGLRIQFFWDADSGTATGEIYGYFVRQMG